MQVLIMPLVWMLGGVVGWNWLTRQSADPETGEERIGKAAIWAAGLAAAAVGAAYVFKRGR